jgi:hypothetical protein
MSIFVLPMRIYYTPNLKQMVYSGQCRHALKRAITVRKRRGLVVLPGIEPGFEVKSLLNSHAFFACSARLAVGLLIKSSGSYVPGFTVGELVFIVGILGYGVVVGELKAQAPSDRSE